MQKYYLKSLFNKRSDLPIAEQDQYIRTYSNYVRYNHVDDALHLENHLLSLGYMVKQL